MAANKRKLIDKRFSLLRGAILGRLLIYRAGPDKVIIVSLEIETFFREPELRKPAAAASVRVF